MLDPKTRRALVCLRYGIGDVVMELPALAALRRALPRAHITALGAFPAIQLLEGGDVVDEVVDLRTWGMAHRWDSATPEALAAFSDWFTARAFDLVLDAHHAPPVLARTVWGRGIRTVETVERVEASAVAGGANGVRAVAEAARAGWGVDLDPSAVPRIVPRVEYLEFAEAFLSERGLAEATPFALSPVASLDLKRWPLANVAALVEGLLDLSAEPILVFCGPQTGAGDELRTLIDRPERLVLVGPLHLLQVASLLARCRVLLSNDTGLMHVAAAVGVPTLGVFGPTKPSIYRPPGMHVLSAEPEAVACPYRDTSTLHPPRCLTAGQCLVGGGGCIAQTTVSGVRDRLRELLLIGERLRVTEHWLGRPDRVGASALGAARPQAGAVPGAPV